MKCAVQILQVYCSGLTAGAADPGCACMEGSLRKSFWIGIQHWYACGVQLESLFGGHHGAILGATSGHLVVISEGIMTVILG